MELRGKDAKVAAVTNIKLAQFSVPFSQAPDENIVAELKMQMDILSAELAKELSEQYGAEERLLLGSFLFEGDFDFGGVEVIKTAQE